MFGKISQSGTFAKIEKENHEQCIDLILAVSEGARLKPLTAVSVFYNNPRRFKIMMDNAMKKLFAWKTVAEEFVALYRKTLN